MKSKPLVAALFIGAVLLCAGNAQAQTEGQPCAAEPTDQLIAYGDHIYPCEIGLVGDSDLFRFQGAMGEVVTIRVVDQAGGSSVPRVLPGAHSTGRHACYISGKCYGLRNYHGTGRCPGCSRSVSPSPGMTVS